MDLDLTYVFGHDGLELLNWDFDLDLVDLDLWTVGVGNVRVL